MTKQRVYDIIKEAIDSMNQQDDERAIIYKAVNLIFRELIKVPSGTMSILRMCENCGKYINDRGESLSESESNMYCDAECIGTQLDYCNNCANEYINK